MSNQQNSPDLQHRDWLLESTIFRLKKIDSNLSIRIITTVNQKLLIVNRITEETLPKLSFLVNTDNNNNYLYLENIQVFLADDTTHQAIVVNGLNKNIKMHGIMLIN